jgi:hypothetical protein
VPCYQFLGGKYRDKIRIYADTPEPEEPTPEAYAERVLGRKEMGLTFIKFDARLQALEDTEARWWAPPPSSSTPSTRAPRAGTGQGRQDHRQGLRQAGRDRGAGARDRRLGRRPLHRPLRARLSDRERRSSSWARRWSPTAWPGWRTPCPGWTCGATSGHRCRERAHRRGEELYLWDGSAPSSRTAPSTSSTPTC